MLFIDIVFAMTMGLIVTTFIVYFREEKGNRINKRKEKWEDVGLGFLAAIPGSLGIAIVGGFFIVIGGEYIFGLNLNYDQRISALVIAYAVTYIGEVTWLTWQTFKDC